MPPDRPCPPPDNNPVGWVAPKSRWRAGNSRSPGLVGGVGPPAADLALGPGAPDAGLLARLQQNRDKYDVFW